MWGCYVTTPGQPDSRERSSLELILGDGPAVNRLFPYLRQGGVLLVALLVGVVTVLSMRSGDDSDEQTAAEALENGAEGVQPVALRYGSTRSGVAALPAVSGEPTETTAAPEPETSEPPAPEEEEQEEPKPTYDLVNFVDHAKTSLGDSVLAPDQAPYGGFEKVGPTQIQARSPITGLRAVIEQSISDVKKQDPGVRGEELERRVARRLTELNDWDNLTESTQAKIILSSGIDLEAMSEEEREKRVNHVLHSPQPFGEVEEILTPDYTIDLSYTHTLDKDYTNVEDQGDGVFRIWMVSNNNDGSHTYHSLGSFKLQLPPGTTVNQARDIANDMVINENDNDRLFLDASARNILYGLTPPLDFSKPMTHDMGTTTTTAPAPVTTMVPETTTTLAGETTSTAPSSTVAGEITTTAPVTTVPASTSSSGGG
jgi:hypothetical protein